MIHKDLIPLKYQSSNSGIESDELPVVVVRVSPIWKQQNYGKLLMTATWQKGTTMMKMMMLRKSQRMLFACNVGIEIWTKSVEVAVLFF